MRVLVAHERAWLRTALGLWLKQKTNLAVVGGVSGADALLRCMTTLQPDLILIDAALPGLHRLDAFASWLAVLRALQPQVYLLVLCGNQEEQQQLLTAGADAVVSTAEPADLLWAALHRAAQIERRYPPGLPLFA